MKIEKQIAEMAAKLKQVEPYVVEFDERKYRVWDIDRLCALASETGSTAKVYETAETNRIKISDPLCRMLEVAGMNA